MAFLFAALIPEIVDVVAAGVAEVFGIGATEAGVDAGVAVAGDAVADVSGVVGVDGAGDVAGETIVDAVGDGIGDAAGEGSGGAAAGAGDSTTSVDTTVVNNGLKATVEDGSEDLYTSSVYAKSIEALGPAAEEQGTESFSAVQGTQLDDIVSNIQGLEVSHVGCR